MQIKTTVAIPTDTHSEQLPPTKQPANDGEDHGERKTLIYSLLVRIETCSATIKISKVHQKNSKVELPESPAVTLLGVCVCVFV